MTSAQLLLDGRQERQTVTTREDRKTDELIFAFVEPIGGGAKHAVELFSEILKSEFSYEINIINVSSIIEIEFKKNKLETSLLNERLTQLDNLSDEAKRINRLQQQGNQLRQKNGADYLAKIIIRGIFEYRSKHKGLKDNISQPLRVAHLVRSIKNKAELELLKSVYGPMMMLVAVSGKYEQQVKNYRSFRDAKDYNVQVRNEYDALSQIDQDEGPEYGQQVRDVFYRANLFINSNNNTTRDDISRFLSLLFSTRIGSPSWDERMMFEAFSASLRSTCLSRQVGAAICDSKKELVSVGWNDVPAFGGGVSSDNDQAQGTELCKNSKKCRSDFEKRKLLDAAFNHLRKAGVLIKKVSRERFDKELKNAVTGDLIEFSRAIHAEMEAILSAARSARGGLRDGMLYVTTYPCDNCVKHILAAGLAEVIYIEPYPKSRAKAFYTNLICDDENEGEKSRKLLLKQFVGIAPESYVTLFRKVGKRKDAKGSLSVAGRRPMPRTAVYLDGYTHYESLIAREVTDEGDKTANFTA